MEYGKNSKRLFCTIQVEEEYKKKKGVKGNSGKQYIPYLTEKKS